MNTDEMIIALRKRLIKEVSATRQVLNATFSFFQVLNATTKE